MPEGKIFSNQEVFCLYCGLKDEEIKNLKDSVAQLVRNCQEKEQAIGVLKQACDERERAIFSLDNRIKFLEKTNMIDSLFLRAKLVLDQILSVPSNIKARVKSQIGLWRQPGIGRLCHYLPKPVVLPKRYYRERYLNNPPMISIVTPAFRHADFIERTMKSVFDQGYPSLEYIVQDGDSNDGTLEILQRYSHQLKYFESIPDEGQSQAINLGFRHATGEIMAYLNSDDLLLPGSLAYIARYFQKHPDVDVVYGQRILIDENDQDIGRWILPPHDNEVLSWADFVPQETLFWRRRIWDKVGGAIDESFKFAMDWDLILRFRDAGAKFVRLPRFLGGFRVHPQQKSSAVISTTGIQEMARLRERCLGRAVTEEEIGRGIEAYVKQHLFYDKMCRLFRQ